MTIQFNKLLARKGTFSRRRWRSCSRAAAGDGTGLDASGRPCLRVRRANSDFQEIQDTIFTPICTRLSSSAPTRRRDCGSMRAIVMRCWSTSRAPKSPGTHARQPGQSRRQLPRAENPGHRRRRRAHARERPALSSAGSQIDLVRGWIAAGAPMSRRRRRPLDRDQHAFPPSSEQAAPGLGKLTVIFNANVDSSRVSADAFTLRDASDQPSTLAGVRVPAGRQNVVETHHGRSRSRPAAINSPCTATDPRRSPTNPVTCSTATPTASPAETRSFPSMSTQEDAR